MRLKTEKNYFFYSLIIALILLNGCNTGEDSAELKSSMSQVAKKLEEKGDYKNALQFYEKSVQENPEDLDLKIKYASVLNLMGFYPDARRELRNVLKNNNTLVKAKIELAKVYINENKPEEALNQLNQVKAVQELNANQLMLYGIAHDLIKNFSQAQRYYRHALKLEPNNVHLQSNYALSLVLSGQFAQGIKILEEINALSNATAKDRHNLAVAYGLSGQFDKAKKLFSQDLKAEEVLKSIKFLKRVK